MVKQRQMKLGLSLGSVGYHNAAWRQPEVPADGAMRFDFYRQHVALAEAAKFDAVFIADMASIPGLDNPAVARDREHEQVQHEPFALLAALAAVSSNVGLIPTLSTTYNHPFATARNIGALDHLSGGRAGWNFVTGYNIEEAQNFGYDAVPDPKYRHGRATEFVEVVRRLFEGADAEAKSTFEGEYFNVRGPLDLPPLPQGQPPVFAAGMSEASQDLAARVADIVYAGQPRVDDARVYYASMKNRLAKFGRSWDDMLILPGLMPYIGKTRQEAQDKFDRMQSLLTPELGIGLLIHQGFPDYTGLDLDSPVPRLPPKHALWNHLTGPALARAWDENLSIRQFWELVCVGFWSMAKIGTAEDIADEMEEWFTTGAADGFNIQPPYLPTSAEDFVTEVIPELRKRGRFRHEYESSILRENLGLPDRRRQIIQ